MVRNRLAAALALAWLPPAVLAAQTPAPRLDSLALRAHTYFLAHDLLLGRATGKPGAELAALYIATQAERLGLLPAGEQRSFFQAVPLVEADIVPARTILELTLLDSSGSAKTEYGYDTGFIPNAGTARTLVPFAGPAAFVGSPRSVLEQPESLPPLAGRVALVNGLFGPEAAAADTLKSRGAVGIVHLLPDAPLYRLYVDSRGAARLFLADSAIVSSFVPDIPAVIASPMLMRALMARVAAAGGAPRPVALADVLLSVRIAARPRFLVSRNVAALLPGADAARRGELIVYTAHLDHLGVGPRDAAGDSIFNGFSDNAAGAAMLLAIAQSMAAGPRPARSVLFLWLTGEERGLLGSDYFVARPTVRLASIAGVINLDAGAPPAPSVEWRVSGAARSSLGELALDVARAAGWRATAAPASPNTDYFPFLRAGVPAVFLVPGPGAYEGMTLEESQALRAQWDHYHRQSDNWRADYPFRGLLRYAEYAWRLGMALGAAPKPRMIAGP
ncbi:MAG: hypothetical protein A2085_01545 [Gemmatimonadetes bacterium GWC2_71_10]|nr:MAG: hypothetical protein A2085_01545 [Gemmatimonadetes bacterium GWC2_71_10]